MSVHPKLIDGDTGRRPYCAFFDVDGTLINTRSVLSFLEYLRHALPLDGPDFRRYYESLTRMLLTNQSREDVNRFYYTIYEGLSVAQIGTLAARWFASASQQDGFYNESALDALSRHRAAGARVVFVTGSFLQLVAPLARKTGADTVLCSTLEQSNDQFTGRLLGLPCIGAGKARAVLEFARQERISLDECHAYGDDQTDLPMLELVGYPTMVTPAAAYRSELSRVFNLPAQHGLAATEQGVARASK